MWCGFCYILGLKFSTKAILLLWLMGLLKKKNKYILKIPSCDCQMEKLYAHGPLKNTKIII